MSHTLHINLVGTSAEIVEEHMLAQNVGSGNAPVYATPRMIALMENASMRALEGNLEKGYETVGIEIDASHISPTPLGMEVRAEAQLIAIEGKILTFRVTAYDEVELIGEAMHKRAIINTERFCNKAAEKLKNKGQ